MPLIHSMRADVGQRLHLCSIHRTMKKHPRFFVICPTCGNPFETTQRDINRGRGKHCSKSCATRANSSKHGHTTHRSQSTTYHTWTNMRARCNNPTSPKYSDYGARGISVCERWNVFSNFLQDMGPRPAGTTLDRINGELGYFKGNCRWATPRQQQRNIKTNVLITIHGRTQCTADWCEEIGISRLTLKYRMSQGWSDAELILPPHSRGGKKKPKLLRPNI